MEIAKPQPDPHSRRIPWQLSLGSSSAGVAQHCRFPDWIWSPQHGSQPCSSASTNAELPWHIKKGIATYFTRRHLIKVPRVPITLHLGNTVPCRQKARMLRLYVKKLIIDEDSLSILYLFLRKFKLPLLCIPTTTHLAFFPLLNLSVIRFGTN